MAITTAPFALKNLGLDAEPLRQALASIIPNGGGVVQTGDLAVTQTTVVSLGVLVGIGRAWMAGSDVSNLSGQAYSTQGDYFAINDAPYPVNLATADPTNPRIDLIYIGAVDTQYGGATDVIKIDRVTGTPAPSPAVPTLPKNAIKLAQVAVAANAATVTNANITSAAPIGVMSAPSKGLMARAILNSSDSVGISALAIATNIASFAFKGGRKYRIGVDANYYVTNTDTISLWQIATCSTADAAGTTTGLTTLFQTDFSAATTNRGYLARPSAIYEPVSDVTLQVKIAVSVVAGSGTLALQRAATTPSVLYIEDLGAQF